jgi:protein FAM50
VDHESETEKEKNDKEYERQLIETKKKEREDRRKKITSTLSFQLDDDENQGNGFMIRATKKSKSIRDESKDITTINLIPVPKKILKNPEVDTSFLPDRERDLEIQEARERLQKEWLEEQERIKLEVRILKLSISFIIFNVVRHYEKCING